MSSGLSKLKQRMAEAQARAKANEEAANEASDASVESSAPAPESEPQPAEGSVAEPEQQPDSDNQTSEPSVELPLVLRVQTMFGEADEEQETIETRRFPAETPVFRVKSAAGLTINLGDYQSARVDASLEIPCVKEEIDGAFAYGAKKVEEHLNQLVEKFVNE